jgi:hypothetical protein
MEDIYRDFVWCAKVKYPDVPTNETYKLFAKERSIFDKYNIKYESIEPTNKQKLFFQLCVGTTVFYHHYFRTVFINYLKNTNNEILCNLSVKPTIYGFSKVDNKYVDFNKNVYDSYEESLTGIKEIIRNSKSDYKFMDINGRWIDLEMEHMNYSLVKSASKI